MKSQDDSPAFPNQTGIGYAVAAFLLWGILPVYWKALKNALPLEILAHRIIWAFVFMAVIVTFQHRWMEMKHIILRPVQLMAVLACAVLVSVNWGVYIWAVNTGHIVDSSLGYYINPLLSVCFGMLILRERLNFWQWAALFVAAAGVLILTLQNGKMPWIAFILAISFGLYGLVKKMTGLDPAVGLTLETWFLAPAALGYLIWLHRDGGGVFGNSSVGVTLLLIGAGIITAVPLLWFAQATRTAPLSAVGFIQYLTPTMMLLLGVFLYHEKFLKTHFVCFGFIWCALALFSLSQTKFLKAIQPARFREHEGDYR